MQHATLQTAEWLKRKGCLVDFEFHHGLEIPLDHVAGQHQQCWCLPRKYRFVGRANFDGGSPNVTAAAVQYACISFFC